MFERFHADARQAVVLAREEAVRMGQGSIGCEHLLLGVMARPDGPAARALSASGVDAADVRARIAAGTTPTAESLDADALASLGIDLDAVRRAAEASFGRGALDRAEPSRRRVPDRGLGGMRLTGEAKKALELALRAAVKLRSGHISAGHLLIGIIDQGGNAALATLTAAGADPGALRADVVTRIAAAA